MICEEYRGNITEQVKLSNFKSLENFSLQERWIEEEKMTLIEESLKINIKFWSMRGENIIKRINFFF